ncbi:MAG: peptidylprolyl isomerase [Tissierellia bacterium]|nr:peptidylprolyl isomerase [Tissierellia bacterium]
MKIRSKKMLALALCAGLLFTSCAKKPPVEGAVAKVNEEYITEDDVNEVLDQYRMIYGEDAFDESTENGKNALVQIRPEIIEMLVRDRMMKELEKSFNIEVTDEEINDQVEMFKGQIGEENYEKMLEEQGTSEEEFVESLKDNLQKEKLSEALREKNEPSEEEIMDYITKNSKEYVEYDADHILISTVDPETQEEYDEETKKEKELKAQEIYERLEKGEDFEKIAKEESEDPGSAEEGGKLGAFLGQVMVPEFTEALSKMKEGEISKPVKSDFGYHIIRLNKKVEDFNEFSEENQDQAKGQVEQMLTQENIEKYFKEQEKDMDIERY